MWWLTAFLLLTELDASISSARNKHESVTTRETSADFHFEAIIEIFNSYISYKIPNCCLKSVCVCNGQCAYTRNAPYTVILMNRIALCLFEHSFARSSFVGCCFFSLFSKCCLRTSPPVPRQTQPNASRGRCRTDAWREQATESVHR